MKTINYFGYGANMIRNRIKYITGKNPQGGYGAILFDYRLIYQSLQEIPFQQQNILKKVWGTDYRCYSLHKGKGIILGTIWKLDEEAFDRMKKWEFIGEWKQLIKVKVKTYLNDTITAWTECLSENQLYTDFTDGLFYEPNINQEPNSELIIKEDIATIKEIDLIRKIIRTSCTKKSE